MTAHHADEWGQYGRGKDDELDAFDTTGTPSSVYNDETVTFEVTVEFNTGKEQTWRLRMEQQDFEEFMLLSEPEQFLIAKDY